MESMKNDLGSSVGRNRYIRFGAMIVLMFLAMFALMYAMVDRFDNVYVNLNQFYMAGLMTAAMIVIELAIMFGMYPDKKANWIILGVATVALLGFWAGIREQAAVSDQQFLKSMIPHHASAILMCKETAIADPEIRELCNGIVSSQRGEIAVMKRKLDEARSHP